MKKKDSGMPLSADRQWRLEDSVLPYIYLAAAATQRQSSLGVNAFNVIA